MIGFFYLGQHSTGISGAALEMRGHKVCSLQESQILPFSLQLLLLPPSQSLEHRLGSFPELPLLIINVPWELLPHGIPNINSFLLPLVSPLSSSVPVTLPLFQSPSQHSSSSSSSPTRPHRDSGEFNPGHREEFCGIQSDPSCRGLGHPHPSCLC